MASASWKQTYASTPDLLNTKDKVTLGIELVELRKPSITFDCFCVGVTSIGEAFGIFGRNFNAAFSDPIVLQPYGVKFNGNMQVLFEIVTAWGPEAQDMIYNPENN